MKRSNQVKFIGVLVLFFMIFFPKKSHAYIDPSVGSYLWQILLAVLCGIVFTLRYVKSKIKIFFSWIGLKLALKKKS